MLSILHTVVGYLLAPFCIVTWLICLVRHRREIVQAEVIVQADRPHAFGTSLNIIEVTRRLHPGKRIVILLFREPNNHNPKLGLIFGPEITFVSWRRPCFAFELFGRQVILPPRTIHDGIAHRMSHWYFRRFCRDDVVLYDQPSLYKCLPADPEGIAALPVKPNGERDVNAYTIDALLSRYFNKNEAPPYQLPLELEADLDAKVLAASGVAPRMGWCGMHLKKDEGADTFKDGSPVEAYLPAIRKVIDAGYQILLKGDRRLPKGFQEQCQGMIVDADSLGVDPDIFNLYTITKSDIFIGDSGPGTWMMGSRDIPSLALNVFPIGLGFSIKWVYFKRCIDDAGRPAPIEQLFSEISVFGNRPEGWKEETISEAEITDAVDQFLRQPYPIPSVDDHDEIVSLLPAWSCFRSVGVSRLSPAWVRKYAPQLNADAPDVKTAEQV
jgi:hypothetical protein